MVIKQHEFIKIPISFPSGSDIIGEREGETFSGVKLSNNIEGSDARYY
jgi:hypothetical protein